MTDPAGRPTILADASLCSLARVAGWAGAIIIQPTASTVLRVEMAPGGCFPSSSVNSAEMTALANTLAWAIEARLLLPGAAVLLATDSQHVHLKLTNPLSRKGRLRARRGISEPPPDVLASPIRRLIHANALVIEVCRIDGHASPRKQRESVRARTMAAVDQHSRKIMKAERARRWRTNTVGIDVEVTDLT